MDNIQFILSLLSNQLPFVNVYNLPSTVRDALYMLNLLLLIIVDIISIVSHRESGAWRGEIMFGKLLAVSEKDSKPCLSGYKAQVHSEKCIVSLRACSPLYQEIRNLLSFEEPF